MVVPEKGLVGQERCAVGKRQIRYNGHRRGPKTKAESKAVVVQGGPQANGKPWNVGKDDLGSVGDEQGGVVVVVEHPVSGCAGRKAVRQMNNEAIRISFLNISLELLSLLQVLSIEDTNVVAEVGCLQVGDSQVKGLGKDVVVAVVNEMKTSPGDDSGLVVAQSSKKEFMRLATKLEDFILELVLLVIGELLSSAVLVDVMTD